MIHDNDIRTKDFNNFAPRVGFAWDVSALRNWWFAEAARPLTIAFGTTSSKHPVQCSVLRVCDSRRIWWRRRWAFKKFVIRNCRTLWQPASQLDPFTLSHQLDF